ncbi:glycosyl hydrolase family 17 protein [uncultured Kordia sp.]|uniref:glycosyl hydrolase family 17 protein n=1 Tax=uncultured Kordia sp. TaxID=507699 RepID=UPI00261F3B29|nr:glycosyl hydrolase family 17 protein [uncultured Kordia sp.]
MSNTNSLFGGSDMMGVCYAPYHQAATVKKSSYTKADVDADLKIISDFNMTFIRTYTVQGCQQHLPELCKAHNIGLALGAWIFQGDSASTHTEIDTALTQANAHPDMVKVIVIGNEVDLASNNYTLAEVEAAFNYAKTQLVNYPKISNVPLTICMTGSGPIPQKAPNINWSSLLPLMQDYAFLTIYPWYGQKVNNKFNPNDITANMQYSYNNGMAQAIAAGLEVVIAEIGWPTAGDTTADTNIKASVANFKATCTWINGTNIYKKAFITMWFEMFDEPWKTAEGPWGPHWGIYGSGVSPELKKDGSTKFTICS